VQALRSSRPMCPYTLHESPVFRSRALQLACDSAVPELSISGCPDYQLSADGAFNGLFTGTLKTVWNGGKFKNPYRSFHAAIVRQMPPDQTPNYYWVAATHQHSRSRSPVRFDGTASSRLRPEPAWPGEGVGPSRIERAGARRPPGNSTMPHAGRCREPRGRSPGPIRTLESETQKSDRACLVSAASQQGR
jgi:hypothetical protein